MIIVGSTRTITYFDEDGHQRTFKNATFILSLLTSHYNMSRPSYSAPTPSPLPPSLVALSVAPSHQVAIASNQYLLIHMVQALRRSASVAQQRTKLREEEMVAEGILPQDVLKESEKQRLEGDGGVGKRMEEIGFRIGGDIAERLTFSRSRFADPLDIVKFICKDVWIAVYEKQVDNLRTNHRGVFVLQDSAFPPIAHISTPAGGQEDVKLAAPHLAFPQGLIRGALARLGLPATVTAESGGLPQVTFQIKTSKLTL
ncbi:Transport protein particle (TRAPP) complex subunit [Phaffia rhodozyma]|uniref:Transport protein particle (TRAPP) complex subunit n=1 Tax=Phaffia rhodozyma TaxID=264483 RepID=A0A0F7SL71_PHARH|nr:Transport protein particle (TRAPP) complex subunit [Phaffia rhodozyma]